MKFAFSCILSVFGAVLVAATVYDLASKKFISCNPLHTNSLYNAEDGDNDPESRITAGRSAVFIAADDDQPLILDTPSHNSRCQRHLGICVLFTSYINIIQSFQILSVVVLPCDFVHWYLPCVGFGVVRIDPLHFLARCRTRRLNQALSVLSLSLDFLSVSVKLLVSAQLSEGSLVRGSTCPRFLGLGLVKWTLGQVDSWTTDYEPCC